MATTFANLPDGLASMALFDQTFAAVPFTPTGTLTSTNVQAALAELDTKKAATSSLANVALSGASVDLIGNIGTWTPVLTFATPGDLAVTYTTQVGKYIQLNTHAVLVEFAITTSAFTFTTASGSAQITGVPFTSQNVSGLIARGSLQFSGVNKAGYSQVVVGMGQNVSFFVLNASGMGVATSAVAAADMPSGGSVILNGEVVIFI